jgi:AraC-like DNA-binding protein
VFFGCQLACYFGVAFDQFTGLQLFQDSYVFAMNMVSLMLLTIGIALLFFPKLLYGTNTDKPIQEKYSHSKLNDESKLKILNDWKVFIEDLQKPYLNPKLSLGEVAEILNTSSRRLSQVINEKTGMNFNDYINSLRVQEAKQLLIGDDMEKLTIETIALKSGFNSKSPFYAAFKKHTGQTPRQFITAKQGG